MTIDADYLFLNILLNPARPIRLKPSKRMVVGSGTGATLPDPASTSKTVAVGNPVVGSVTVTDVIIIRARNFEIIKCLRFLIQS